MLNPLYTKFALKYKLFTIQINNDCFFFQRFAKIFNRNINQTNYYQNAYLWVCASKALHHKDKAHILSFRTKYYS